MSLNVDVSRRSPNFAAREIEVEYLVLHYTACDLERTMKIFEDPARGVTSHFVIDVDGTVYDLSGTLASGRALQGAHAGKSRWPAEDGTVLEAFNRFALGIEMVNLNGNLFPYPDAQMRALGELAVELKRLFPALRDPRRVVGHEQIAGFRGKCDPGARFDWARFFASAYPSETAPKREPLLAGAKLKALEERVASVPAAEKADPDFWARFSHETELALDASRDG
jgi:N-acetyl-anhydromuramyl-L-alanine amidase AmpD